MDTRSNLYVPATYNSSAIFFFTFFLSTTSKKSGFAIFFSLCCVANTIRFGTVVETFSGQWRKRSRALAVSRLKIERQAIIPEWLFKIRRRHRKRSGRRKKEIMSRTDEMSQEAHGTERRRKKLNNYNYHHWDAMGRQGKKWQGERG